MRSSSDGLREASPIPDYYGLLGVAADADAAGLKAAYRKRAIRYHPDKNQDDATAEAKFKAINEAYSVLSNPTARARYDAHLDAQQPSTVPLSPEVDVNANLQSVFGDLFDQLFGGLFRADPIHHGQDVEQRVRLTFAEAARGAEKSVSFERVGSCGRCDGSGMQPGTDPVDCTVCRATGQVRVIQGSQTALQTCPQCQGVGTMATRPCPTCLGGGVLTEAHTVTVRVPAGVDSGLKLRIDGEGEPGRCGGMNGDLYVLLTAEPHPLLSRRKQDVLCEVPVSFSQAALGAEIDVPTIEGRARIRIPAGTQSGKVLRLRNMGIDELGSSPGSQRGDQMIRIIVETPTSLDERQRTLLEQLEQTLEPAPNEAHPQNPCQPARWAFGQKLRALFE